MGGWTLVALVLVGYALVASRLDRLSITAPIVLVVAGTVLGAGFLDLLPANPDTETIRLLTELTLALILFADASTIKLRQAESDVGPAPATARHRAAADHRARGRWLPTSCSPRSRGPRPRWWRRSWPRPTPRSASPWSPTRSCRPASAGR